MKLHTFPPQTMGPDVGLPQPPTLDEMRRVAHYLAETMGLHSAAGKLLAKVNCLEGLVGRLMEAKSED